MKRILLLAVVLVLAWKAYESRTGGESERPESASVHHGDAPLGSNEPLESVQLPEAPASSHFACDGRTHCSQMTSCAEATFFIQNCPDTKMDGNNDGVPCESQWCR